MAEKLVSRGFTGKRRQPERAGRVPPGQYLVNNFPVLSAGPTPRIRTEQWSFTIDGLVRQPVTWTWTQFLELPSKEYAVDISCVTKWTQLDMKWKAVGVDTLLEAVELDAKAAFITAHSYGGYTTNLAIPDIVNDQAFIAYEYDGKPLAPEHGGPARLVVPHLYFWKSAKWVHGFRIEERERLGFWESLGYHRRGDPWKEERYSGD
ncbi:MAG: sulfite oxidase-like oxidoreductase [Chloroflexi bacterium]|nr:MAG: sulfite oxidase-like oxidoreductase [Chloroflexota bacterium]TME44162.1 MAG: sulfite oxidase-like oxidoreductase [Chloroflexota bacterium]